MNNINYKISFSCTHSIYRLSDRYDPNKERKEVVYMSNEKKFKPAGWGENVTPGTYGRLPYIKGIDELPDDVSLDYVIAGVPFDMLTSYRAGTRNGPRAIRRAYGTGSFHVEHDIEVFDNIDGADIGDFQMTVGDQKKCFETITQEMSKILAKNIVPIILGGDHAIAYPELMAYKEKFGPVSMIHFDSHTDTWGSASDRPYPNHGSPFRWAIEDGCIDPKRSIQVGMRGMMSSEHDYDFANEHGLKHILAVDMHHMGIKKTADIIRETVGNNPVMVTFDIDFVDPMFAPGTGTPVPGGFTSFETLELIRLALTGLNTVGFDLVEVAPNYDPSEITELLASRIVHEFIALLACKKAGITEYAYRGKE